MRHFYAFVLLLLPMSAVSQSGTTTLSTGTHIPLAVIRPIWAASAKTGDPLYAQTTFPVSVDNAIAVPAGSYVQGALDSIVKPTRRSNRASLTVHFTTIILANGYAIPLPAGSAKASLQIQVTPANDLLLDNGAQLEITLSAPLPFNTARAASAVDLSSPIVPGHFASATLCRPTPATPGSPDTIIPGTPGTPGTPDTVLPGVDGGPPTIIPGTPATPGTPSTTIPGMQGSSGFACPAPPLVLSSNSIPTSATANHP